MINNRNIFLGLLAATLALLLLAPAASAAPGGGITIPVGDPSGEFQRARLMANGRAQIPDSAPPPVQRAIRAANRISKRPYCWGGGHGTKSTRCFDCSGSLSYVLRAAGLLKGSRTSGGLMSWGRRGQGTWITVYANRGHTFAIIAGLRWDTAAVAGNGPRWSKKPVSTKRFVARHWAGL